MHTHVRARLDLLAASAWLAAWACLASAQTQQEHVHNSAHNVMPFEMTKTIHIFRMTEQGGVQRVVIRDPAAAGDPHLHSLSRHGLVPGPGTAVKCK